MSKFWNFIRNQATETTPESIELRIEGDIISSDDSWIYEWFGIACAAPNVFRNELAQYKGKDITLWVDSSGGDVFAATGMYNALKEHDGKVTAKVTKAMSAATIPTMAAKEVLITPGGIMMMHNPLTYVQGYASDMRKTAEVLDVVKDTIINAYQMKTGKPREEISQMMDNETYMSATMAVKEGFADGILYQENLTDAQKITNFAFNRGAILNSANEVYKRFVQVGSQFKNDKNILENQGGHEEMEIKNVEELRKAYPELVNQVENSVAESAKAEERKRIQDIDEISNNLDGELVNKAKYIEPMNAERLAFEAIKNDASKGKSFFNTRKEEIKNSGTGEIDPEKNQTKEQTKQNAVSLLVTAAESITGGIK